MHFSMLMAIQKVEEPKKRGLGPSRKSEHCSDFREGPSPLLFFIDVLQDLSHKTKLSCVSSLNQRGGFLHSSRPTYLIACYIDNQKISTVAQLNTLLLPYDIRITFFWVFYFYDFFVLLFYIYIKNSCQGFLYFLLKIYKIKYY